MLELCKKSISEIAPLLETREISPLELTRAMLERIDTLDKELCSYNQVTADFALEQAKKAEKAILDGNYSGRLHGIPVGIKDLIFTEGIVTTCSSPILTGWVPGHDATAMKKLNEAGAVMLGKLSMTEFALSGYHPDHEPPKNPWSKEHWPGVSSSGSGVATAASLCFASLGTDTGGSIRYPSAACGIVGIKPTYGKVSRYGVFPLAESLDHIGPMTRCVADAAAVLQVIAGHDVQDVTSLDHPLPDYSAGLEKAIKGLRIGFDEKYCSENVAPEISQAVFDAIEVLTQLGAGVHPVDLSGITEVCRYWLAVTGAEAANAHRATYPSRESEYGPVFRDLLENGSKVPATDYVAAMNAGKRVKQLLSSIFSDLDVLLCPAMLTPPPTVADFPPQMVLPPELVPAILTFTAPFNFSGNPTITLPCGFTPEGLPTALQLVGNWNDEATIIQAGHAYEQATEWHKQRPPE